MTLRDLLNRLRPYSSPEDLKTPQKEHTERKIARAEKQIERANQRVSKLDIDQHRMDRQNLSPKEYRTLLRKSQAEIRLEKLKDPAGFQKKEKEALEFAAQADEAMREGGEEGWDELKEVHSGG